MDSSITINTHVYGLREQKPTMNVRSSTVSNVVRLATTGYQSQKQAGGQVVRTVRKISIPETVTVNGVSRVVITEVSLVAVVPEGATATNLSLAHAELVSWQAQESFVADIFSQQI